MGDENTSVEVMDPASMSASQIDAFMDKGELPPRPEGDEPGQAASAEVEAEDEGSARIEDEPAEKQAPQQKKPDQHLSRAERRAIRLNDENRQLRAEMERLRTERQPAARQEAEQPKKAAAAKDVPQLENFATVKEWQEAFVEHMAGLSQSKFDEWVSARDAKAAEERTAAEQATAAEKRNKELVNRVAEYRKSLGDKDDFVECYQEVVDATTDPRYHDIALLIAESEVVGPLVKFFADNPAELDKLKALPENQRARAFGRLEADPRFKPVAPKTKTSAKRISDDIGGRGGSSDIDDQINEALARGDNKTANRLLDQQEKMAAGR